MRKSKKGEKEKEKIKGSDPSKTDDRQCWASCKQNDV
jgi:hypothetical protein